MRRLKKLAIGTQGYSPSGRSATRFADSVSRLVTYILLIEEALSLVTTGPPLVLDCRISYSLYN